MGLINTTITLRNPLDSRLSPYQADALVDTGALLLCIPEHVAIQLQLPELQQREVSTADGKKHMCSYVGPVELTFENRSCYTGALVLGDEVLLGTVPMEDLDLVISPATRTVTVNPESPNLPSAIAKSARRDPDDSQSKREEELARIARDVYSDSALADEVLRLTEQFLRIAPPIEP